MPLISSMFAARPGAGRALSGTPTKAGTFAITVKVTDSAGNRATESGSITIARWETR